MSNQDNKEISFLTNETLKLSKDVFKKNVKESEIVDGQINIPSNSSGILFNVISKKSLIRIYSLPVLNLKEEFLNTISNKNSYKNKLNLLEGVIPRFFVTPTFAIAERVATEVSKCFPYNEDFISNSGDRSYYWWLKLGVDNFSIAMNPKLPLNNLASYIKLGPLGDYSISFEIFNRSKEAVKNLFSLGQFNIFKDSLTVFCGDDKDKFKMLKNIFYKGIYERLNSVGSSQLTVSMYLEELAFIRKFFISL